MIGWMDDGMGYIHMESIRDIPIRITRLGLGSARLPGTPTGPSTGPSSDLGASSRSTGLSRGLLDRLCSPEVARERAGEASERRFGMILGAIWGRFCVFFCACTEKLTPLRLQHFTCVFAHAGRSNFSEVFARSAFLLSEATWQPS